MKDFARIHTKYCHAGLTNCFLFENHNVYKNIWYNIQVRPAISIGFSGIADCDSGWKWAQTPWIRHANAYGELVIYGSCLALHTKENMGLLIFRVCNIYLPKCSLLKNFPVKDGRNTAIRTRHEAARVSTYDQGRANRSIGTVFCKESRVSWKVDVTPGLNHFSPQYVGMPEEG